MGLLRMMVMGLGLATALAMAGHVWPSGQEAARAQQPFTVGYDMNTAGNGCPGDGSDCSVGPIDVCVSVNPGDSLQFDVFLQGLPEGENFSAFDLKIVWGPPDWLDITERIHNSASVNLLVQIPGSALIDMSPQELPIVSSPEIISVVDFALPVGRYDEANPPFTQGVLGRYSGQVAADTAPGLYALALDSEFASVYKSTPEDLCELYGCNILDGNHAPQYGLVAVGQECPAGPTTPEPGAEGSPTVAPTGTIAAPTASPAATPTQARATPAATGTPGPAGASTPATVSSDNDGTDWGSPVLIVLYVVAGFVGGLAVAGIAYLGTKGRRA